MENLYNKDYKNYYKIINFKILKNYEKNMKKQYIAQKEMQNDLNI